MEKKLIEMKLKHLTVCDAKKLVKYLTEAIKIAEEDSEGAENVATTYEDVMNNLYRGNKRVFFPTSENLESAVYIMDMVEAPTRIHDWDNCNTEAQAKRIQAFNKLQNIAICLNDVDWKPKFGTSDPDINKAYTIVTQDYETYNVSSTTVDNGAVFFQTYQKAVIAIDIMGKESLADLFNTKWL